MDEGRWIEAARLYTGSFLRGLDLRAANDFNDWLDVIRADYRHLATEALEGLQVDRRWPDALHLCVRLSEDAPPDIELGQALARIRRAIGEGVDTPGLQPGSPYGDGQTSPCAEVQVTSDEQIAGSPGALPSTCFVGRKREFAFLKEAYAAATVQGPLVCLVEGEAGLGKTALLDRFQRWVAIKGGKTLAASGYQLERNVPFGIVAQLLGHLELPSVRAPWVSVICRAFPDVVDLANGDPPHGVAVEELSEVTLYRLQESLCRLFLHLANDRPVVLCLDDAHHADMASLGFFHYLSRSLSQIPLLLLMSLRSPGAYRVGDSLLQSWNDARQISLPPLNRQELGNLLNEMTNQIAGEGRYEVESLHEKTGGNPFLASALIRHGLTERGEALPETIVQFLQPQLEDLSANARMVLNALSVLEGVAPLDTTREVSGLSSAALLAGLSELEALGFVEVTKSGASITHGLVREVTLSHIPASVRRSLFGRAARHHSDAGTHSPAVIAIQHDIAGNRDKAFSTALSAAHASQILHAHAEREFFLKLAMANAPNPDERGRILLLLAELMTETGRPTDALEMLDANPFEDASSPIIAAAKGHRILARIRLDGHVRDAFREAPAILESIGSDIDPLLLAKVYSGLGAIAYDLGQGSACIDFAERAANLAKSLPASAELSRILIASVLVRAAYRGHQEGDAELEALAPLAEESTEGKARFLIGQGMIAILAAKLCAAEKCYLAAIELCERSGLYDLLLVTYNNLAVCYIEQGRYKDALIQLNAVRAATGGVALRGIDTAVNNLAQLRFETGDYQGATDVAEGALPGTGRTSRSFFHLHGIRGLAALELGRLAAALESLREIELALGSAEYWSGDMSYVEMFLARVGIIQGDQEKALQRLSQALEMYDNRDALCRARIEAEYIRYLIKIDPPAGLARARQLKKSLEGSGAVPLLERVESLVARVGLP